MFTPRQFIQIFHPKSLLEIRFTHNFNFKNAFKMIEKIPSLHLKTLLKKRLEKLTRDKR